MSADVNNDYFMSLADNIADLAVQTEDMLNSETDRGRKKGAAKIVKVLDNIMELKERHLKMYTLCSSAVLKIKRRKKINPKGFQIPN